MKKYPTTSEFKLWHKRRIRQTNKRIKNKKHPKRDKLKAPINNDRDSPKPTVLAPRDFRLLENTSGCLAFFRELRSDSNLNHNRNNPYILVSLKYVTEIDYGTISIFSSLSDDLKAKRIVLQGDFPVDERCKKFMEESGFLEHMYRADNKKYPKAQQSQLIFFEKGSGILSEHDNMKISGMVKNVVNHLTGESKYCLPVKTIILEICGNSIEWGGTDNKQWLLGVKYEPESVVFSVCDVGKGILETLNRKFKFKFQELFTGKSDHEILRDAFNQKYGSNTKEVNRNKGLPAVKYNFTEGTIQNLKVLTNNVILHFDNENLSKTLKKGDARFKGTFYQWTMTKDCITKIR